MTDSEPDKARPNRRAFVCLVSRQLIGMVAGNVDTSGAN
jgi:hypothetical protein